MNIAPDDQRGPVLNLASLLMGAALGAATALLLVSRGGPGLSAPARKVAVDWRGQAAEALARGREQVISAVEHSQTRAAGDYSADAAPVRSS